MLSCRILGWRLCLVRDRKPSEISVAVKDAVQSLEEVYSWTRYKKTPWAIQAQRSIAAAKQALAVLYVKEANESLDKLLSKSVGEQQG